MDKKILMAWASAVIMIVTGLLCSGIARAAQYAGIEYWVIQSGMVGAVVTATMPTIIMLYLINWAHRPTA